MNILHIGLGKTGTSSLQKHVFSKLKTKGLVDTYNDERWFHKFWEYRYYPHHSSVQKLSQLFHADTGRHMISTESLLTWNPAYWQQNCDYLHSVVGPHATILITLREPKSYLRSLYQQCIHGGNIIRPELFFLNSDQYTLNAYKARDSMGEIFDCDSMDFQALAEMYAKRFDRVVIASMKSVRSLSFMRALMDINDSDLQQFKDKVATTGGSNKSYSDLAMRLTFARERLLNWFGLKSMGALDRWLYAPESLSDLDYVWFRDLSLRDKLYVLPRRVFTWRRLMQSVVSKYIPSKPYELPENTYLGKHIKNNESFYAALESEEGGYRLYERSAS
ncbi:MAG: hypothetical protein ACN2B6_10480 [Rickettsiales bacterium]